MSAPKKKRWASNGTKRMAELGRRNVQIWFAEHEYAKLKDTAHHAAMPMAAFLRVCLYEKLRSLAVTPHSAEKPRGPKGVNRG